MKTKKDFHRCAFADNQFSVYKEHVNICNTDYKMLMQREITGDSDNKAEVLCVNSFQFIPQDSSVNYMLCMGYDGKFGTYSFSFSKNIVNQFVEIDDIISSPEELPTIKEYFRDHYESSRLVGMEEIKTKYEDFSEILYAMFDYCYDYLIQHGFHIAQINQC